VTERETFGVELLLSEPEIVAWLGLHDGADDDDDDQPTAGSLLMRPSSRDEARPTLLVRPSATAMLVPLWASSRA
jgi:hypothetical protein